MTRPAGIAWCLAAGASLGALATAAFAWTTEPLTPLALAALGLGLGGTLIGLAAVPLALAPAEALRASLASRRADAPLWGIARKDAWGALARDIAAALAPPPAPEDHGLEMRRLAAHLELTLRQTGEEIALVSGRMAEAAGTLEGAAEAGARLSAAAGETLRELGAVKDRAGEATGALARLPALAAEQADAMGRAAERSLAAAEAIERAAGRASEPPEPGPGEIALREAATRGAEQARRLEQAMPLLLEAVSRLPAAAAQNQALAATAEALREQADRLADGVARIEAVPEALEPLAERLAPPDPETALAPLFASLEARLAEAVSTLADAARSAADETASRVADMAELIALQGSWRAGDSAAEAVARLEAASAGLAREAEAAQARLGDQLGALAEGLGVAQEGLERRVAEAISRVEAPLGEHQATLASLSGRFEGLAGEVAARLEDRSGEAAAAALAERGEALLGRIEALAATLGAASERFATAPAVPVSGAEPLDSVAERLLAELADGEEAGAETRLKSLDETIRTLQSVAGAMGARR